MGLHWALPLSAALLRLSGLPEAALGELSASVPWNRGTERENGKTWGKLGKIMGKMAKTGENHGKNGETLGKIMGKMAKTRENHGRNGKNWGIVEELGKKLRKCCENLGTTEKDVGIFRSF